MIDPVRVHSEVRSDGVLVLNVPMGEEYAHMPVVVTIAPSEQVLKGSRPVSVEDWHAFVEAMYGRCTNLGLEEPNDLPLQNRLFGG